METTQTQAPSKWPYRIFTALFAAFMLLSAIPDLLSVELAKNGFAEIQLPAYLLPFLGCAKTLGVIAILLPSFKTLKEWAYAGLFFDLIGAIYCVVAGGKSISDWAPIALPLTIGIISYIYYNHSLII
jgi:hypothetical protein